MDKRKRNSLAGTKKGTSESAKFFQNNEKSRKKKIKYNKEYNARPDKIKYRVELNRANRKAGTYGNLDGLDMSHDKSGKMSKEAQSKNRARNGKGNRHRLK